MTDIPPALFYGATSLYLGALCFASVAFTFFAADLERLPRVFTWIVRGLPVDLADRPRWPMAALRWTTGSVTIASQVLVAVMLLDPTGRLGHGLPGQVVAVVELLLLALWGRYVVRRLRASPARDDT